MGDAEDESTTPHDCETRDSKGHLRGEDQGVEELIARLLGTWLPAAPLQWTEEHENVPLAPGAEISLAGLAAHHTLLIYLTIAEDDSDPNADTMGRALRNHQDALNDLCVETVGISTQPIGKQHNTGDIELFTQRLLCDAYLVLAKTLGLPLAPVNDRVEYQPIILIAREGRIAHVIYPITSPRASAEEALDWLTEQIDKRSSADEPA